MSFREKLKMKETEVPLGTSLQPDEVDIAFQSFALALARAASSCTTRKVVAVGAFRILVSAMKGETHQFIVGPASLALSQLSLIDDEARRAVVEAGGLPTCAAVVSGGGALAVEMACKTLASVALVTEGKRQMSEKGAAVALATLLCQRAASPGKHITERATVYGLFALSNGAAGSDANRNLFSGLGVVDSVRSILAEIPGRDVVLGAANLIANLSFTNAFAAETYLRGDCVRYLVAAADAADDGDVRAAVMIALANLSNSAPNQLLLGDIDGAEALVLHTLRESEDAAELTAASLACGSMSYESILIRTRMGQSGFVEALVDVVMCKGLGETADCKAAEAASLALVSLLAQAVNRDTLAESGDLTELVDLYLSCDGTESMAVLNAGGMVVAALVPRPRERAGLEGRRSLVEDAGGGRVLTRCAQWVYGRGDGPPNWLKRAIAMLEMMEEEGAAVLKQSKGEGGLVQVGELSSVEPSECYPQRRLFQEVTALPRPECVPD